MKRLLLSLIVMGCAGPIGPAGPTGSNGLQGLPGVNGSQGPTGATGPQGLTGVTGPQGDQGLPGAIGLTGSSGSNCTVSSVATSLATPTGGALVSCTDGTSSLIINGTVITLIQFCHNNAPQSYPNVFNESGFCIAGSIYAVYSANGGFLSQILPGTYSSNGINSSCNFTVGSNCSVSN
jgi:hypothetical protein